MPKFDRKQFNEDPKHEGARSDFDAMVEDSLKRVAAKQQKENPPKPTESNFITDLLDGMGVNLFDGDKK